MFILWKKIRTLYRNNFLFLVKWTVFALVLAVISAHGVFLYYYAHIEFPALILDWFIISTIVFIIIQLTFHFIFEQKGKMDENVNELLNSYEYIGSVNRKIEEILDLKLNLEETENEMLNHKHRAEFILSRLVKILNASGGAIHFLNHEINDIMELRTLEENHSNVFHKLSKSHFSQFINTQNQPNHELIKNLELSQDFIEKYNIIIKPIYLNKQDIAQMYLVFPKIENIVEQDVKIVRLFSFYLAASICFKK